MRSEMIPTLRIFYLGRRFYSDSRIHPSIPNIHLILLLSASFANPRQ
jgi:hypothetical protein